MFWFRFLNPLRSAVQRYLPATRIRSGQKPRQAALRSRPTKLRLEQLEARTVPAAPMTTITTQAAIIAPTFSVHPTAAFPPSGDLLVQSGPNQNSVTSVAVVNYMATTQDATGLTTSFTGCSVISGDVTASVFNGFQVQGYEMPFTTIAAGSNGQTLINAAHTITVASLAGFRDKTAALAVKTSLGFATVQYTGLDTTHNQFTGVTLLAGDAASTLATGSQVYASIPFAITNSTGLGDSVPIYYAMSWLTQGNNPQSYYFNSTDTGASYANTQTLQPPSPTMPATLPTYPLSFSSDHVAYINLPAVPTNSARIVFGINLPPVLDVNPSNFTVAAPDPGNPTDHNRDRYFDFVEFTNTAIFNGTSFTIQQYGLNIDTTLVDQMGAPIVLQATPPDPNVNGGNGVGVQVDRTDVVSAYQAYVKSKGASVFEQAVIPGGKIDNTSYPYRILAPKDVLSLDYNQANSNSLKFYFNPALKALFEGTTGTNQFTVGPYTATTVKDFPIPAPANAYTLQGTLEDGGKQFSVPPQTMPGPLYNFIGFKVSGTNVQPGTMVTAAAPPAVKNGPWTLTFNNAVTTPPTSTNLTFTSPYQYTVLHITDTQSKQVIGDIYEPFFSTNTLSDIYQVSLKDNVATLTTRSLHGFFVNERVVIQGVKNNDGLFNGTFQVTDVPGGNAFSFKLVHEGNITFTPAEGGTVAGADLPPPPPWIPQDVDANHPGLFKTQSPAQMVFSNNGVFADNGPNPDPTGNLAGIENQIVSALNRGVANLPYSDWAPTNPESVYYQPELPDGTNASNFYAGFWHYGTATVGKPPTVTDISLGQLAYGFPFDDQGNNSTDFTSYDPTNVSITLVPWQPATTVVEQPALSSNQAYVDQLYQEILGRNAEDAGLQYWTAFLDQGSSREQVARGIWESLEHRQLQVYHFYADLLHRAPDANGLEYWIAKLMTGTPEATVELGFLTSDEYAQDHPGIGYIGALYSDVLHRQAVDVESAYWEFVLTGDTIGHEEVPLGILTSLESTRDVVDDFYAMYLNRSAATAEESYWLDAIVERQFSIGDVAIGFLSSDEFFKDSQA